MFCPGKAVVMQSCVLSHSLLGINDLKDPLELHFNDVHGCHKLVKVMTATAETHCRTLLVEDI